jgi:hypothetical protein
MDKLLADIEETLASLQEERIDFERLGIYWLVDSVNRSIANMQEAKAIVEDMVKGGK